MTDTAEATSDVRACTKCESPFGEQDDRRFKACAKCRGAVVKEEPKAETEAPPAPKVAKAEDRGVEVMSLDVVQAAPPPAPPREFYWCGATKDSPVHNITLGGISFPKFTGEVREGDVEGKQKFVDNLHDGQIHSLTEATVELVMEHAKGKVIRNYRTEVLGNDPSGEQPTVFLGSILSTTGSRHRPYQYREGDLPLGNFVYMVKVRGRKDRPIDEPPPLVERRW